MRANSWVQCSVLALLLPVPAFALAPQGPTVGGITYANTNVTAIPDNSNVTSTITVSGAALLLLDLSLQTFIQHTAPTDLEVTLTSPAGTIVTITTDNGGGDDDVFNGTVWDDDGGTPVTDASYANGVVETPLVPEGAFGAFSGEDPNGVWTLSVTDDAALETGSFTWSLNIAAISPTLPITNTTVIETTPIPLPDRVNISPTLAVSGAQAFLVEVELFVAITHTFPGDLDITLTSPSGTVVAVTTNNGGGNNDTHNGTLFDDDGLITVTDAVYANNVVQPLLVPEGAFGAFAGEDPNGTWILHIVDEADIDEGTLTTWELRIRSTERNVVQGQATGALVSKASFSIDFSHPVDGGGSGDDKFTIKGTLPSAGMLEDLTDTAFAVGCNGVPLAPTVLLDSKGKNKTVFGSGESVNCSLSSKNGAFSATVDNIQLAAILGLANVTEEGEVTVEIEISVAGSGMLLSRGTGTLVFAYSTKQDKSSKGSYSFKSSPTLSSVFVAKKTSAREIVGIRHEVETSGSTVGEDGFPLVPTADLTLVIGDAAPITIPLASIAVTGDAAESVVTLTPGSVAEILELTISNAKKTFSIETNALANTGIPIAGAGEPLNHVLSIRLTIPTAEIVIVLVTLFELRRQTYFKTIWQR